MAEQFRHEDSALLLITARLKRGHQSWSEGRYLDVQSHYEMERTEETQAYAIAWAKGNPNTEWIFQSDGCVAYGYARH